MVIRPLLGYARELLGRVLQPGDVAVDGTMGNGHDLQFLAECVGPQGRVFGFDVQEQAVEKSRERLQAAGALSQTTLLPEDHARMLEFVPAEWHGKVKAVTFNFGYLPGGDESVVTTEATSIPALRAALELLAPGGVITAMLYNGHPEGRVETEAVLAWAESLELTEAHVLLYRFLNQKKHPPVLVAIEKRAGRKKGNK